MGVVTHIVAGCGLGAVAGALSGLLFAILTLQARRWRNARLVARGEPAIKDASLPRAFVPISAILAALVAGALAPLLPLAAAVALGAAAFPTLVVLLSLGFAVSDRRRSRS